MEEDNNIDDSMTWKGLVNELRLNLEEKSRREQILNSKYDDKMSKLEDFIKEEKLTLKKLEDKDSEIAQLKIKLRRMKPGPYGGSSEDVRRPSTPLVMSSSSRKLRRSLKRPQTPKVKMGIGNIEQMLDEHQSSFTKLKTKLLDLKSKMNN